MVRWPDDLAARWQHLVDEVSTGMKDWRLEHPRASLHEIETALDDRLGHVRARMLEDVTLTSLATDLPAAGTGGPGCPACGGRLQAQGMETRHLTTSSNQTVTLTRSAARCPACERRVFPPG